MNQAFDTSFKRTDKLDAFKDAMGTMIKAHPMLGKTTDIALTFANEMAKTKAFDIAFRSPVVWAVTAGLGIGGWALDKRHGRDVYGLDDVVFDALDNFIKVDILPTADTKEGRITTGKKSTGEGTYKMLGIEMDRTNAIGKFFDPVAWNLNGYSIGKTVAEMLPYSLVIAGSIPKTLSMKSKRKMVEGGANVVNKQGVKSLNGKTILSTLHNKFLLSDKGRKL